MKNALKVVKNANIILENGILHDGVIVIENDKISNVFKNGTNDIFEVGVL